MQCGPVQLITINSLILKTFKWKVPNEHKKLTWNYSFLRFATTHSHIKTRFKKFKIFFAAM